MVIFDLDQTLIDSRTCQPLRKARKWPEVYKVISGLAPYGGIDDVMQWLMERNVPIGVVTSSPRPYCTRVLAHIGWKVPVVVAYHDTARHKPHPDPILRAIELGAVAPADAVHVGDSADDTISARAAGVLAIGAAWGSEELKALNASRPDVICQTPLELKAFLKRHFSQ